MMAPDDPEARSMYFFIRAHKARFPKNPRVGFTATKRTFKFATDRNRAKRLLRDWVRFHANLMHNMFDYVFIARVPILGATRDQGRLAMEKALRHITNKYVPKKKRKNVKNS